MKTNLVVVTLLTLTAACNTLLDNEPALPMPAQETALQQTLPGDGGALATREGGDACEPCLVPHATPTCHQGRCAVGHCDDGFRDCNGDPADGCEVDLSVATSCGSCDTRCPSTAPLCAPTGAGFACTTGCSTAAPTLCGSECVSLETSSNHCGGCNQKCPSVSNADVACEGGACNFLCRTAFHRCGDRCALDVDPNACGPSCVTCPAAANAWPTCSKNACSFTCRSGYANCNGEANDGCEIDTTSDNRHCGGCGKACTLGTTCKEGRCVTGKDGG